MSSSEAINGELEPGAFYWVLPGNDWDYEEEWEARKQPARFSRYRDDGQPLWYCLNIEGESEWPMIWVGPRIEP